MATKPKETIETPEANEGVKLVKADARRKALVKEYRTEDKVPMYLSPMYQPYLGRTMTVSINGISIFFAVDGSTQMVPKTFADEITSRRINIDSILNKQGKMSDVVNNHESSPGELKIF